MGKVQLAKIVHNTAPNQIASKPSPNPCVFLGSWATSSHNTENVHENRSDARSYILEKLSSKTFRFYQNHFS